MSKNPAYGLTLTFLFPGILKMAMIGSVMYCTSMILLMIDSFCQKISGSMLLPYVFLQSIMGITLLACSIILNLIFAVLRYPQRKLGWQMLFVTMTVVAVMLVPLSKKKSPYVVGFCSFTCLVLSIFITLGDFLVLLILTTYYLPLPLIWSLLEIKKTCEFLEKGTSQEKSKQ